MEELFGVSVLESAPRHYGNPQIFNTDQGAQYRGKALAVD